MGSTATTLYKSGQVVSTAADLDIQTVGFVPRKVIVSNLTAADESKVEWNEAMADAAGIKTVAAGTRTVVSSAGITPLAGQNPGFRIGALANINDNAGEVLMWEAFG